jgi:tetratricopeptide (TPR) repeat protein
VPPRVKKPKDPVKLVRTGIFALNRKKWKKASRRFELALQNEEVQKESVVWANYGIALTNLNQLSEALSAFSVAVELDRKREEFWIKKGLLEFKLNSYSEAEKSFTKAGKLNKKNDEIPILTSRCLRKKNEINKAIKLLESGIKKFPDSAKIPIELAKIWDEEGDTEKSYSVLEKSIAKSKLPDPGLLLGQLLLDKLQFGRALEVYRALLIRYPNSPRAQYGIGVAYHAKKEYKKALESYKSVVKYYQPKRPPQSLFISIARVLKELNRNKEAIDALYKAKKLGKQNLEISLLLAELFMASDRADRAKRALEDAFLLNKKNPVIPFYLGMTNIQLNQLNDAKQNFRKSLELDLQFNESKIQLALLAIREKNFQEAYTLTNEVINSDPNHKAACLLTAQLAFDLKDYRRTVELLQTEVKNDPFQIKELELLLNSWLMLSQPEKAHSFMADLFAEHKELHAKLQPIAFFDQFTQKK